MSAVVDIEPERTAVAAVTPMQMLQIAVQQGADLDKLQRLMDLEERWRKAEAKRAYDKAIAAFKQNPPKVVRDKENKQYKSWYSSLENLVNTVNSSLSVHGLNARWEYDQSQQIRVTCILSHVDGHEERVSLLGPPDTSGSKNSLQQIKSTLTYLRGATFEAVTGIATAEGNLDDDGNGASAEYITEKQVDDLMALADEVKADRAKFLAYMKVSKLAEIPSKDYQKAVKALEAKRSRA